MGLHTAARLEEDDGFLDSQRHHFVTALDVVIVNTSDVVGKGGRTTLTA